MEHTKNPLDQTVRMCLPQKKEPNLFSSAEADLDLSLPIISDGQIIGAVSSRKCIWSSSPFISVISHCESKANFRIISYRKVLRSTVSI